MVLIETVGQKNKNLRLRDLAAKNSRIRDAKNTRKRDFETHSKRLRDFEIGTKISETLNFPDTIRHPYISFHASPENDMKIWLIIVVMHTT